MITEQQSVEWLKELIRIPTISGNEKQVADHIKEIVKSEGISTYEELVFDPETNRSQLIVTLKGAEESSKVLGITGHMDVVPIGEEEWNEDPFSGYENKGKIYGRGSTDMKSGLMAAVIALINLKRSGKDFKGTLKLLLTAAEETSAMGSLQLTEAGYANDLTALIAAEPTSNYLFNAEKGAFWLEFKTTGQTAHGSTPQNGINAIDHMLYFIERFRSEIDFAPFEDELLGKVTASLDVIQGGNATNVVPDSCIARFDIRTTPALQHQYLLNRIEEINQNIKEEIADFKLEVNVLADLYPVSTPFEDPFTQIVFNARKGIAANQNTPLGYPGYTDAAQFTKVLPGVPILVIGPGDVTQSHQPNEYVIKSDYLNAIQIFTRVIHDYLEVSE